MPPAPKKARTDGDQKEEGEEQVEEKSEGEPEEQGPPPELEQDASAVTGAKVKEPLTFQTQDTTLNCIQSAFGNILMPLTDCGLQYLLAGARSNVGLRSGRYLFEVKVLELMNPAEDPGVRQRLPVPRNQLRIGVSVAGSSLFMGDTEDSICFDMEGACLHNKSREMCSEKFGQGDILGVVVNLDSGSPNANTISLFKNGERASQPQALPSTLLDKELFPAFTFKNVSFHSNFGPSPLASLPFTCHMVSDALANDVVVAGAPEESGKTEVVFPVGLPDEGTFDWLDLFLQKHKDYTELSDRAILAWAERSGFSRQGKKKTSNDKPEMGFGIPVMDDGSLRRLLHTVAPMQQRNYVVMEVKSNLIKDERSQLLARWAPSSFKRTAAVMMGDPPQELRRLIQELALKAKQEASDAEFRAKKAEVKRKKQLERRQKQLERERKKAAKIAKKKQEALRRKLEAEKRKRERAARGEDPEDEVDESKDEDGKEEEKDSDEDLRDEEMSDPEEQPSKVELTGDERRQTFRRTAVPDMTSYALSTSFMKFSIPEKVEGFDEIRHEWNKADQCDEYLKQWVRDRKVTVRIEDLQPSEWFTSRWKDWQKTLQAWHAKYNQYKAALSKKAALAAAKAAKKKAEAEKGENQDGTEDSVAEEAENEETEGPAVDFNKLDVFGVEDVLDIGGGQPLFSAFLYEDWAMMSLRFEIYLLTHSFRRDVNDPDRVGILLEHLPFYYQKYFKKALNTKLYGADSSRELLEYVEDTIVVCGRNEVVQAMLPDDMESFGVFAMITEESRRDRVRRVNLKEEGAALKMSSQPVPGVAPAGCRPAPAAGAGQRPAGDGAARPAA